MNFGKKNDTNRKHYRDFGSDFSSKETVYINGDIAIKPYFYLRNGLLHARFTVDRAVELSETEEQKVKEELARNPSDKQGVLAKQWNFFTDFVQKPVLSDGIRASIQKCKKMTEKVINGQ